MLKFLFWTLLLANGLLFAYERGYFEFGAPSGREPARMRNQLNADKVKIVPPPDTNAAPAANTAASASAAAAASAGPSPAASPAASAPAASPLAAASPTVAPLTEPSPAKTPPAASSANTAAVAPQAASIAASAAASPVAAAVEKKTEKPDRAVCIEIGNFNAEEAKRFMMQLKTAGLDDRATEHNVHEVVSSIVYIPPQPDREGAEKKAGELQRLGITDFYIIQDNSPLRWGISLGVFKTEEAARNHLAALSLRGVRTARIGQRSVAANLTAYRFRGLETEKKWVVEKIKASGFSRQHVRTCSDA